MTAEPTDKVMEWAGYVDQYGFDDDHTHARQSAARYILTATDHIATITAALRPFAHTAESHAVLFGHSPIPVSIDDCYMCIAYRMIHPADTTT